MENNDESDESSDNESNKEDDENANEKTISMDTIISRQLTTYSLVAKSDIKAFSQVFLIDHMWTTTFAQHRHQLKSIEGLAERISIYYLHILKICYSISYTSI